MWEYRRVLSVSLTTSRAINVTTMGFHKSTLVARGANTQLDPSCVSAPPATNVDLFTSSFVC